MAMDSPKREHNHQNLRHGHLAPRELVNKAVKKQSILKNWFQIPLNIVKEGEKSVGVYRVMLSRNRILF
jgi:hypothetical protein